MFMGNLPGGGDHICTSLFPRAAQKGLRLTGFAKKACLFKVLRALKKTLFGWRDQAHPIPDPEPAISLRGCGANLASEPNQYEALQAKYSDEWRVRRWGSTALPQRRSCLFRFASAEIR